MPSPGNIDNLVRWPKGYCPAVASGLVRCPEDHPRRCIARSKSTGKRCGLYAVHGAKRCHKHRGRAEAERNGTLSKAARRSLAESRATRSAFQAFYRRGIPSELSRHPIWAEASAVLSKPARVRLLLGLLDAWTVGGSAWRKAVQAVEGFRRGE